MTKSLFSWFSHNPFARKLSYIAGPSKLAKDPDAQETTTETAEEIQNIRFAEYKKRCDKCLDSKAWMILSVLCTITSLVAFDFTIAFLPKEVDISTDIILLIVFWFFFVELIVASIVRKGYFLSFWFWLDFIAMISMIPDLTLLLSLFGAEGEVNIANTQASKAGKSGRSAVALKAIRMVRFSRLLRVLRVFKFFQAESVDEEEDPVDAGSSKVGQIVSEAVTKKVIILVLVLVLVLPWMDPTGSSFSDAAITACLMFKELITTNAVSTDRGLAMLNDIGADVLYINIGGNILVNHAEILQKRRTIEIWTLDLSDGDSMKFDLRPNILEESALGLVLTIFAIIIFATSTLFINASTMTLVVQPIARLTELLMRMAGVIGLLGGAQNVENLMEEKDELFIVEALCGRIMDIFGGNSGDKSADDGSGRGRKKRNSKKALSMMASKKITEITSGDRIWEIDVREKHRTSVIEEKVQKSFVDFQKSEAREEDVSIDHEGWKELKSLQAIVDNPITLYCLRMFMTSNLTINNLLFILEAEEWQNRTKGKFEAIYHKYCDDRSPAQINLNANMFEAISKVERGEEVLTEEVFEEAMAETWNIMELNVYKQFLKSDYCKFYVHMKQNDAVTLNQLQLSVIEPEK